ncbi:MAG: hypothetical protein PF961_07895 [Planctomycetota bacterium]|nr:hypothetical protein [Planctomycetota bacterium]
MTRFLALLACSVLALPALDHVVVDWAAAEGAVPPRLYGINLWGGMDPDIATAEGYRAGLEYLAPEAVRLHSAEMLGTGRQSWLNHETKAWNAERIATVMQALDPVLPATRMITIPHWPDWMKGEGGRLDTAKTTEYADFCASLVRIVNVDLGMKVQYWEPVNEIENRYKGKLDEMGGLFKACADAMRAVDPSIKICGAAWTHPYQGEGIARFLDAAGTVDVATYHNYGSGDKDASDDVLWDAGIGIAGGARGLRKQLDERGMADTEIWLGEHNVFWTWRADHEKKRMAKMTGALFDALNYVQLARSGAVAVGLAWNDHDGTYGKMVGEEFRLRPAGHLMHLLNRDMVGEMVLAQTTTGKDVTAMAVVGAGHRAVLLINRGEERELRLVQVDASAPPTAWTRAILANSELTSVKEDAAAFTAPAHSVTVLRWPPIAPAPAPAP